MNVATSRAVLILGLAFLAVCGCDCLAQPGIAVAPTAPAKRASADRVAADMVLIRGAVVEMRIDRSQVPRLEKLFHVDAPQLFEAAIPRHVVTLDSFYMDKYLVTNAQFKKFTDANPEWRPDGIRAELHNGNYLKHWNEPDASKADHPVVSVNWYAAVAYCRWAGKRLPTEAEWEHAARGGPRVTYPWGDEPVDKSRANYSGSGIGSEWIRVVRHGGKRVGVCGRRMGSHRKIR